MRYLTQMGQHQILEYISRSKLYYFISLCIEHRVVGVIQTTLFEQIDVDELLGLILDRLGTCTTQPGSRYVYTHTVRLGCVRAWLRCTVRSVRTAGCSSGCVCTTLLVAHDSARMRTRTVQLVVHNFVKMCACAWCWCTALSAWWWLSVATYGGVQYALKHLKLQD